MLVHDPFLSTIDRWMTGPSHRRPHNLPVDAVRTDHGIELRFDLPGVAIEDIDLTVEDGVLRLAVRRDAEVDQAKLVAQERWHGEHSRSFRLAKGVDTEQLASSYAAGVLTVRIPHAAVDQPRRIPVEAETTSLAA